MSPRALVLIAMLLGLFLVLFALVRWGESFSQRQKNRQHLAQRDRLSTTSDSFTGIAGGAPTRPVAAPLVAPAPNPLRPAAFPSAQSAFAPAPSQLGFLAPSKIMRYLTTVGSVEKGRQGLWTEWWGTVLPSNPPTPDPSGNLPPTPLPPDLLQVAGLWDRSLSGSAPDSTCLPFHLAYLGYLALERDYMRRLMLLHQNGAQAELMQLRQEMDTVLSAAARRVQAKLRELQHDHPELSPELRQMEVLPYTNLPLPAYPN